MTLFSTAPKWAIASHNKGKIKEIAELIAPYGLAAEGAESLGLPEPEETEKTFTGNALLKARASAEACGLVSLADDSGLEVTALDGAPGIYSARWAGEPRDFHAAMDKVRAELEAKNATDYSARFVCALALAHPNGETRVYEGEVRALTQFRLTLRCGCCRVKCPIPTCPTPRQRVKRLRPLPARWADADASLRQTIAAELREWSTGDAAGGGKGNFDMLIILNMC